MENRQVSVEVPIEGTKELVVERPVVTYETIEVEGVVSTQNVVQTQVIEERTEQVSEDVVSRDVKEVPYEVAFTVMNPTAVEGPVKVEGDVELVAVSGEGFVKDATETCAAVATAVLLCPAGLRLESRSVRKLHPVLISQSCRVLQQPA